MSLVEVQNISKIYRVNAVETKALNNVSLKIESGEFTVLAGPSGSGKTTLLNLIGGLDTADSGSIQVDQESITSAPQRKLTRLRLHKLGFVFQAYNLIPVLTSLENVEYIMLLQGVKPQIRREKALRVLEEVGLKDYIHRKPLEMSGGQQQRVAVARAIVSEPKLVLADEPTANLDSHTAIQLLELMEHLNHGLGMTFLFSTHDQRIIERAHRVVRLEDGKIINP